MSVTETSTNLDLLIDDGTGQMQAKLYADADDEESVSPPPLPTLLLNPPPLPSLPLRLLSTVKYLVPPNLIPPPPKHSHTQVESVGAMV